VETGYRESFVSNHRNSNVVEMVETCSGFNAVWLNLVLENVDDVSFLCVLFLRKIRNFSQFLSGQARSQGLRFEGTKYILMGKDFCFYYMFKTIFSEHNKIWGHK